jgi:soluble lytic murein transglycosylase-like protein
MISGIAGNGFMAGGGIDAIESRIQQLEGMISAIETRRAETLAPAKDIIKSDAPNAPKPFQFYLNKTPAPLAVEGHTDRPVSTVAKAGAPSRAESFQPLVKAVSTRYDVDQDLVNAVIHQESGFNPNAVSKSGAAGLMQLMPKTAHHLGVSNPRDPQQNLEGGVRYLKGLLNQFNGNIPLALAAYNAGPGAVNHHKGIPPYKETQHYVRNILAMYLKSKQSVPA